MSKVQVNTTDSVYDYGVYGTCRAVAKGGDGRIWVAYHQNDATAGSSLYVAYSDDEGLTWVEEKVVDDEDFDGSSPQISLLIDSKHVPHIIYTSDTTSSGVIYHTSRANGVWLGATGGKASLTTVFTNGSGAGRDLYGVVACIDSNDNIHLAGSDSWTGGYGTFYFKYTALTQTWGSIVTVASGTAGKGKVCQIVVDSSGNPHVALAGGILLYHSTDGGATFGTYDTDLYSKASGINAGYFDMAIDSTNNIHIAYRDNEQSPEEIRYIKGTAENWGTPITIATAIETTDYWYCPAIVLDLTDNAYIIYQLSKASTTVDDAIYYVKVTSGVAGTPLILLTSTEITYPGASGYEMPSIISGFWQNYPSSSILSATICPTVIVLHVNGDWGAIVYYVSGWRSSEGTGVISVVEERFHWVGKSGTEYWIEGVPV